MKPIRILLWAAVLVGLLLGAVTAFLPGYLESHRAALAAAAGEALGRPVSIAGPVALVWSPGPSIAVDGLRIENPSWATGDAFLTVGRVKVQLDLAALLQRRIELARIVVERAELHLEAGAQDRNNWSFGGLGAGGSSAFDFRLDTLEIRDSAISFQPAEGAPRSVAISRFDLEGLGSPALSLTAAVTADNTRMAITAESDAGDHPRRGRRPFKLQVAGNDARLQAEGSLQWGRTEPRPRITADLRLTPIDLTRLLHNGDALPLSEPSTAPPSAPADARAAPARDSGRSDEGTPPTWMERPLSLAFLQTFDADLWLNFERIGAGPVVATGLQGHVLLDDGRLRLEDLAVSLPGAVLTGEATADLADDPPRIDLVLAAERVQLPQALSFLSAPPKIEGGLQAVALEAEARGHTPAVLIASLGAEITAAVARLRQPGGAADQVVLNGIKLSSAPGAPMRLRAEVAIGHQTFSADIVGGLLADLLPDLLPDLIREEGGWPSIEFVVAGDLQGDAARLRGEVGPLSALLAGRNVRVDLTANYRQATATLAGTLAALTDLRDSRAVVKAAGPSLSALRPLIGAGWSSDQGFELSARLEGGDRSLAVQELKANIAGSDLAGNLRLSFGARPRIRATLRSRSLDLTMLQSARAPSATAADAGAWMQTPLPLTALRQFDADLTLQADLIKTEPIRVRDLALRALLDNGRLQLERLRLALPGTTITSEASVDTSAAVAVPTMRLALAAERIDLPRALSFLPKPPAIDGSVAAIALSAKARGATPAGLIETLTGELTANGARLRLAVQKGDPQSDPQDDQFTEISIDQPSLAVDAGQPVRLRTNLTVEGQSLSIDLTGGRLADLLTQAQPWPKIEVAVSGELFNEALVVRGHVGPLGALLAARDLGIDLSLRHPDVTASVQGGLTALDHFNGSKLAVDASGRDLSALGRLAGLELPGDQPFDVRARLAVGARRLDIQALTATVGDSDLRGDIRLRFGGKPQVVATVAASALDLTPYLTRGNGGPARGTLSLSDQLPLALLHTLDGTLDLRADHLRVGDFGVDDASLNAILDDGYLHLSTKAGQERLNLTVALRPTAAQWQLDLSHSGKLDLAWLIEDERMRALSKLPIAIELRLRGLGDSIEALLGSANGRVELAMGAGRFNKKAAKLPFGAIIATLLDAVNPLSQQGPFQDLQCAVLQFDIADGIATSHRGLALRTASLNVLGSGALNLRTEQIRLHFKTAKRHGFGFNLLGIADKFIYINGTLRKPHIAVDPGQLLIEGGAAWATAGLSILYDQLLTRLTAFNDPCETVLRRGEKRD